jgi:hypothetical protein
MESDFFLAPLAARHWVSITGDSSARRRRAKILALASPCPRLDRNGFVYKAVGNAANSKGILRHYLHIV